MAEPRLDRGAIPHLVDLWTGATRKVSTGDVSPNDAWHAVSADGKTAYFVRTETVTNLW